MAITSPTVLDDDADYALDDLLDFDARLAALRERARGMGPVLRATHRDVHELRPGDRGVQGRRDFPAAAFYANTVTDVLGRNIQCMYGDEHRRNRALASPAFRRSLMPALVQPLLEPVAHELVDRFEARGEADLVADFTTRYPFKIILRMLGLPQAAEEDVTRWALGMLDIQQHYDDAVRCSQEFVAFVDPIIQQRRTEPADDLISQLATAEVDGERLTDDEILNFLKLLFPAGADTTYLGLGNTLLGLLTHPDELAHVCADLDEETRWAAEEGLRWNAPVAILPRHNPRDVEWNGIAIPADTPLLFAITAANRDPAVFTDPDRFDVRRRATGTMAFGFGTHFCLGAHLARAEIEVSLRVLLERLPRLRLVPDDDVRIRGSFVQLLRGPNRLPVRFD